MKKILPLLLILCLLLTACTNAGSGGQKTGDPGGAKEAFTLYPAYLQLPLGQHFTMDASDAPKGKALVWTSSDTTVATVDENGRITPVAEGQTIITAAFADNADKKAMCGVLVAADGNIFMWDNEED